MQRIFKLLKQAMLQNSTLLILSKYVQKKDTEGK